MPDFLNRWRHAVGTAWYYRHWARPSYGAPHDAAIWAEQTWKRQVARAVILGWRRP